MLIFLDDYGIEANVWTKQESENISKLKNICLSGGGKTYHNITGNCFVLDTSFSFLFTEVLFIVLNYRDSLYNKMVVSKFIIGKIEALKKLGPGLQGLNKNSCVFSF